MTNAMWEETQLEELLNELGFGRLNGWILALSSSIRE